MRAGPLRHRVTLQSQTQTRTATGAFTKVWADVTTVWAQVEPSKGGERWAANTNISDQPVRVTVRYSSTLASMNTSWRVVYGSRKFDIESVSNNQEADRMLVLICSESKRDDE